MLSSTFFFSIMSILASSSIAKSANSSSDMFHMSSPSLQKYSRPIQTLSSSATMYGLQLLNIWSLPILTSLSCMYIQLSGTTLLMVLFLVSFLIFISFRRSPTVMKSRYISPCATSLTSEGTSLSNEFMRSRTGMVEKK